MNGSIIWSGRGGTATATETIAEDDSRRADWTRIAYHLWSDFSFMNNKMMIDCECKVKIPQIIRFDHVSARVSLLRPGLGIWNSTFSLGSQWLNRRESIAPVCETLKRAITILCTLYIFTSCLLSASDLHHRSCTRPYKQVAGHANKSSRYHNASVGIVPRMILNDSF